MSTLGQRLLAAVVVVALGTIAVTQVVSVRQQSEAERTRAAERQADLDLADRLRREGLEWAEQMRVAEEARRAEAQRESDARAAQNAAAHAERQEALQRKADEQRLAKEAEYAAARAEERARWEESRRQEKAEEFERVEQARARTEVLRKALVELDRPLLDVEGSAFNKMGWCQVRLGREWYQLSKPARSELALQIDSIVVEIATPEVHWSLEVSDTEIGTIVAIRDAGEFSVIF